MSEVYDLSEAKRLVASLESKGMLDEHALRAFAERRKYEETIAALAQLSRSRVEVVRPLMQSLRDDGVFVSCKVAQIGWETVRAILQCRYAGGSRGSLELMKAQEQFAGMNLEKARQLLRHLADLFSRSVVGWSMNAAMTAQLVTDALVMAIWRRGKPDALCCIILIAAANTPANSSSG
jgi:transposase InsO family protein